MTGRLNYLRRKLRESEADFERHRSLAHEARMKAFEYAGKIRAELKEIEGGRENSREEVTGLGGSGGKNRNFGNSGFSGGSTARLAAA